MSANMTIEQAMEMRRLAIERATSERLPDKIMYLCSTDPGNVSDIGDVFTRPLAGGNVFLKYYHPQNRVVVEHSERPGKLLFEAIQELPPERTRWRLIRFRSGTWVDKLLAEYDRITYRKDNADVIELLDNFAVMDEDSHA